MPTAKQYSRTIRRHLKLADHLDGLKPKDFEMANWFTVLDQDSDTDLSVSDVETLMEQATHLPELPVTDDPAEFLAGLREHRGELSCGLAACMGGYAVMLWPDEVTKHDSIEQAAKRILGDDVYPVGSLFNSSAPWQTPKAAAKQLRSRVRYIAETMFDDPEAGLS